MNTNIDFYRKNLKLILAETFFSSMGAALSISVITVFFKTIGMNQADIGFVQMMFTIVICFLDIPMGYIADKYNRKVLNIIGDFGVAVTFVFYGFSKNIIAVIICECLLGVFMACTNGVDQSFIKYNCDQIDNSGKLFKKVNAKTFTARYIGLFGCTIIGGFIAKYSIRLSICLSGMPYFIASILAILIKDDNVKAEIKHRNLFKDMVTSTKSLISDKKTRVYLITTIAGRELTHAQVWVFTPLLIMVGIPVELVSLGWVLNYLMQILGSKVAQKFAYYKTSKKFAYPVFLEFVWMIILIFHTNIFTIWLFALNNFVHGLLDSSLTTSIQESVGNEVQTSIVSIASTGARLLYIPLVYVINYLGNIKLQFALLGSCVIMLPMCIYAYTQLKKIGD